MTKKEVLDYSHIKNQRKLLKNFANKYPNEVYRFLDFLDQYRKLKTSNFLINFSIDNPPPYERKKLKKRDYRRFCNLDFHIHYRQMFISYMEYDLIGRNPRLVLELISRA